MIKSLHVNKVEELSRVLTYDGLLVVAGDVVPADTVLHKEEKVR